MQYREFGRTGKLISTMGMGANRFSKELLKSTNGLELCAEIIVKAAELGVNFFDSASTYSSGECEKILRIAFSKIKQKCYVCGKSSSLQERTSHSVIKKIETSLKNIEIDYFDFYYMWSIKSYEQFEQIMSKNGPYEGAVMAKERGLIQHICFSSHASAEDTIKIIKSGAFEGVLLSYSLLNFHENKRVLEIAKSMGMGVAIMNPLGGGIIPQNPLMFSSSILDGDENIVDAALKFVCSRNEITTVLCGISDMRELLANEKTFSSTDIYAYSRYKKVENKIEPFSQFCTKCDYCCDCPVEIEISTIMQAYNQTKFNVEASIYNISSPELNKRANFFRQLDGKLEFINDINPCINCGKCEKVCTQSLPIRKILSEIYSWISENSVSLERRQSILNSLIHDEYKRVGLFTAGIYTAAMINLISDTFKGLKFELIIFDSNPDKWGELYLEKYIIRNPVELLELNLDVLIITNYIHSSDIYIQLMEQFPNVNIRKLHDVDDLPWFY